MSTAGETEQPQPTPPPAPVVDRIPGWSVTFAGGGVDVRSFGPTAAFALGKFETVHPSVPAEGFVASYSAELDILEAGRYRFACETTGGKGTVVVYDNTGKELAKGSGSGPATRQLPGGTVTNWVELQPGRVTVSVRFSRLGAEACSLRAVWERSWSAQLSPGQAQGFRAEPLPYKQIRVPRAFIESAKEAKATLRGRTLLGELGCVRCHDGGTKADTAVTGREGPKLDEIGRRASADWLLKWILAPQDMKPGTPMPAVLGSDEKAQSDAIAIVHYLLSKNAVDQGEFENPVPPASAVEQGRKIFHTVGCVACHGPQESPSAVFGGEDLPSELPKFEAKAPYGRLGGKWRVAALSEFLLDPLRVRPSGRMPNMGLKKDEAEALAAYLTSTWNGKAPAKASRAFKVDPALAKMGEAAFTSRGCVNCHEAGAPGANGAHFVPVTPAKSLAELAPGKGCLDAKSGTAPRYSLSLDDREALGMALAAVKASVGVRAPVDETARRIEALNCRTCHIKDGFGGVGAAIQPYFRTLTEVDLGDEGRNPPQITQVGWKSTTNWLRRVLLEGARARPWMATRMPQFGASAEPLVTGLSCYDGVEPNTDGTEPQPGEEMVIAGRALVGEAGLNCISCHTFADFPEPHAPAPNLAAFSERLRYDWYKSYVLNPGRFKPGTRMSAFFQSGRSTATQVMGGEPDKQTDALWAYFGLGKFAPTPQGLSKGSTLAIAIGDKPVVFRTFLKSAGSRGIAVGYPIGTHFAFDASAVRLVEAWKGSFMDASGVWKGRGGETIDERKGNDVVWTAPEGPAVVLGADVKDWPKATGRDAGLQFRGYRLGENGVPMFMYDVARASGGSVKVEEVFEPSSKTNSVLRRTFTFTDLKDDVVWVNGGNAAPEPLVKGAVLQTVDHLPQRWFRLTPTNETVTLEIEVNR